MKPPKPLEVGREYPVTEVLGWWLQDLEDDPEWVPVLGPLHEDGDYFDLRELHFHIDPRFLDDELTRRVEVEKTRTLLGFDDHLHPVYRQIVNYFALGNGEQYFWIEPDLTVVRERDYNDQWLHPPEWGQSRIRTRRRMRPCTGDFPEARISEEAVDRGFRRIRYNYRDACGDICPHRGYDLRSVPIDADGYRQCPLHQLRLKAPPQPETTSEIPHAP